MTLNDIIVSALTQLDRGHDSQTMADWQYKFIDFANEAAQDLALAIKLRRSDTVTLESNILDILKLPRGCVKVLSISQNGTGVAWGNGPSFQELYVGATGPVLVEYQCLPNRMGSPTDRPELPDQAHSLIVTYVVARERAAQDASSQRGANVYFELYNAGKRELSKNLGDPESYKIKNKW